MLRRDFANQLYSIVVKRFYKENPECKLTNVELDNIWFTIYGKLCHGETFESVKKWCEIVELRTSRGVTK